MALDSSFPLEQELLAHRGFVRRLARRLVSDEARAEDVTQEVWVRALDHPPVDRGPMSCGALRGWLARVTRNVALNSRRAERRQREHEARAARSERVAAADCGLDLQERLVRELRALDEPHRAVLLLRYFEELGHAKIATELDLPVATVRTRLQRGLAKLRTRLDRASGGKRENWLPGLALLTGKDVLTVAGSAGSGLTSGGLSGAFAMGVMAKVGILALAGGALWWMWSGGTTDDNLAPVAQNEPPATGSEVRATAHLEHATPLVGEPRATAGEVAAAEPDARSQPTIERGWVVMGRVTGLAPDGIADARVSIVGVASFKWPVDESVSGELRRDGGFEIDVTPLVLYPHMWDQALEALLIRVDHPLHRSEVQSLDAEPRHQVRAELEELDGPISWWAEIGLRSAGAIAGRVEYADGTPAAGVGVGAWRLVSEARAGELSDSTFSDEDGAFLLRVVEAGEHVVCAAELDRRPATRRVSAVLGERTEVEAPLVLAEGAVIEGHVLRFGEPLAGASITVAPKEQATGYYVLPGPEGRIRLGWLGGAMEHESMRSKTDAKGRYRFAGLRPLAYVLTPDGGIDGYRIGLGGAGPEGRTVVATARGVDVLFAYASVRIENEEPLPEKGKGVLILEREGQSRFSVDFQGWHGIPAFTGPPGERMVVELRFEGMETWREPILMPPSGEELELLIHLQPAGEPGQLELTLKADAAEQVEQVVLGFFAEEPQGDGESPLFTLDAAVVEGVARFESLHPGSYRVVLRADSSFNYYETYYLDHRFALTLGPGQVERRTLELERGGRIRIVARDERGEVLPAAARIVSETGEELDVTFVEHREGGYWTSSWRLGSELAVETFPNFPPGPYELRLSHHGLAAKTVPVVVQPGKSTPVEVVLEQE